MRGQVDKAVAQKEFTSHVAGAMFEANSFISTSYNARQNVFTRRDYQLEIYADKGANNSLYEMTPDGKVKRDENGMFYFSIGDNSSKQGSRKDNAANKFRINDG